MKHQFGAADVSAGLHVGIVYGTTCDIHFKFDTTLIKWRKRISAGSGMSFGEILESMKDFQLDKLRKNNV